MSTRCHSLHWNAFAALLFFYYCCVCAVLLGFCSCKCLLFRNQFYDFSVCIHNKLSKGKWFWESRLFAKITNGLVYNRIVFVEIRTNKRACFPITSCTSSMCRRLIVKVSKEISTINYRIGYYDGTSLYSFAEHRPKTFTFGYFKIAFVRLRKPIMSAAVIMYVHSYYTGHVFIVRATLTNKAIKIIWPRSGEKKFTRNSMSPNSSNHTKTFALMNC